MQLVKTTISLHFNIPSITSPPAAPTLLCEVELEWSLAHRTKVILIRGNWVGDIFMVNLVWSVKWFIVLSLCSWFIAGYSGVEMVSKNTPVASSAVSARLVTQSRGPILIWTCSQAARIRGFERYRAWSWLAWGKFNHEICAVRSKGFGPHQCLVKTSSILSRICPIMQHI